MSKFKKGQRVKVKYTTGVILGTIAKVDYAVSGYIYWVDLDEIGCKIVNSVMIEEIEHRDEEE